jgi:hypothetical protein
MAILTGNALLTTDQIIHTFNHLAAISAGILFLLEGGLLGVLVFARNGNAVEKRPKFING